MRETLNDKQREQLTVYPYGIDLNVLPLTYPQLQKIANFMHYSETTTAPSLERVLEIKRR